MRFGRLGSDHDEYYGEEPNAPDGYIHEGQALEYVFENQREAVEEAVRAAAAAEWLRKGKQWLDLLNIVSRYDKERLRETIRTDVIGGQRTPTDELPESELFGVASDASKLLESIESPYAKFCTPSDDLTWSKDLIRLTRAFREMLFLISELEDAWMVHVHLQKPLAEINSALMSGRRAGLDWEATSSRTREFRLVVDPELTPLYSHLAEWICEFLISHSSTLGLAVCTECATIFVRERRDNVYCSKTCQNRVAYKRRKIFESGVLAEVKIDPEAPSALLPGLWINHPRLGLGRIEAARFTDRQLRLEFKGHGFSERIPDEETAEEHLAKVRKGLREKLVKWEEVVDPGSIEVRVRFLQIARSFRSWDIFPRDKKSNSGPSFYRVADPATLADLL